jgi:Helix-turn-helix domain of resolvase
MTFERPQEIRALVEAGGCAKKSIAEEFGISPQTLRDIIMGRTWRPKDYYYSGSR